MDVSFSLIEILAFAGLFQCVSILVYLFFRAGRFSLALAPALLFINLSAALYLDFGISFFDAENNTLAEVRFWIWTALCPLSILFILQCADLSRPIPLFHYMTLSPLMIAGLYYFLIFEGRGQTLEGSQYMHLLGAIAATLSLPFLWLKKNVLENIRKEISGVERYWMILVLIALTIGLIGLEYSYLGAAIMQSQFEMIRSVIGLVFVYIAATYLFRIYPAPIKALTRPEKSEEITQDNKKVLAEIEHKLEYEKVYLEPAYGRSDMAQELKVSESLLSKLINQKFEKSFPMILNDYRVKEACQLLEETGAPIKVIAEEVGFNSLASFNRVFKENMNETASSYRQKRVKEASRKIA